MRNRFLPLSRLLAVGRPDDLTVCHDGDRRVTWLDFSHRIGGLAHALAQRHEQRWLIHCSHPLDFCAALLAVLHTGKRAVITPGVQPGLLTELRPACDAIIGTGPGADLDPSAVTPRCFVFEPPVPEAAFIDLFTSGSSGTPKRVEKSLAQLETEAQVLESCWGSMLSGAAIVATVPHHHIYGMLFRLVWPLAAGRPFDAALCAEPQALLERLAHVGAAALVSSPAHLTRLPELIDLAALAPTVRCIFSSGGPLPAGTALAFERRLGRPPLEIYGSTETGGIAWRRQAGGRDGASWTPFPGIRVRTADDGALCLSSPYLAQPGWMTLGDRAQLLAEGRFLLGGRLDRVAKIEGKRVALPDVERRLREHPWVADAGVVPLEGRKQTLGAVVVLQTAARRHLEHDGRHRVSATLRQFLRHWFEPVLIPRRWRFLDRLPLNDRGKLAAADLVSVFRPAAKPLLPEIRAERRSAGRVELDLHVPVDLAHFDGHFPGHPILPGVVQIDWAVRIARERLALEGAFAAMENVRFQSIVTPGIALTLVLALKDGGTRLAFTYAAGARKCSSGTLVFRAS